jgi:polyisoprenyl-phosphate glycosyltransferase
MTDGRREDVFVTAVSVIEAKTRNVGSFATAALASLRASYANYELVLIDNGIEPSALAEVMDVLDRHACVRLIRLSQHENHEVATFAGLEASIGDYVVAMVPGQDPVHVITDLVTRLRTGIDIVFGVSERPLRRGWFARLGTSAFYWYSRRVMNIPIPANSTYLIGMSRRTLNALTRVSGRYRHIRQLARQVGFKSELYRYLPEDLSDPNADRSLLASVEQAVEISITYSRHPLRFVSLVCFAGGLLNLGYAAYTLIIYLTHHGVAQGWTTLSLEMALMFFLLFVLLAVLAEYVGRTHEEVGARPEYHIMEELTSTVLIADETRRNVSR